MNCVVSGCRPHFRPLENLYSRRRSFKIAIGARTGKTSEPYLLPSSEWRFGSQSEFVVYFRCRTDNQSGDKCAGQMLRDSTN